VIILRLRWNDLLDIGQDPSTYCVVGGPAERAYPMIVAADHVAGYMKAKKKLYD
jgi:hypothetical protein